MASSISSRPGEFELIREVFAPLSLGLPGAVGLTDDVALISPPPGCEVVLNTDAIVEGVHFRKSDPPESIAKKALRVNISDFAAKGASPHAYLLALALPEWPDRDWLERFAGGLAEDQREFAVTLAGGDTVRSPGGLYITVTLAGFVPQGVTIRRHNAAPGDIIFVTGTIGDAGMGLELLKNEAKQRSDDCAELVSRYRVPRPPLAFGQALRGIASASLDVSDGLIADLGHIAEVSHVRMEIDADRVPLSPQLRRMSGGSPAVVARAATAGDDYEIAFTVPASKRGAVEMAASQTNTSVTEIGRVLSGRGAALTDAQGNEIPLAHRGYSHF
jgi:thiamine-monophosphate kinase